MMMMMAMVVIVVVIEKCSNRIEVGKSSAASQSVKRR